MHGTHGRRCQHQPATPHPTDAHAQTYGACTYMPAFCCVQAVVVHMLACFWHPARPPPPAIPAGVALARTALSCAGRAAKRPCFVHQVPPLLPLIPPHHQHCTPAGSPSPVASAPSARCRALGCSSRSAAKHPRRRKSHPLGRILWQRRAGRRRWCRPNYAAGERACSNAWVGVQLLHAVQ